MRFVLDSLLTPELVEASRQRLLASEAPWRPGVETAGWHAREVKNNRQLESDSALAQSLVAQLEPLFLGHPLFRSAVLPLRLHGWRFSRAGAGEGYGRHVDNAFMAGGRADVSFTLFLSDPADYGGGGLWLEHADGEEEVRLAAGSAFVYPSTLLHRVEPVQQGERLVVVGWVQSRVRDAEQRELLFELDTARRTLFQQQGKSACFDLISRSYSNLLRRWGE